MKLNFVFKHNMIDFMKKSDRKIFFAGIRAAMKDSRITQGDFAAELCCDQTTISNYMNLKTRPQDEHYDVFLRVVGRTKNEIMDIGYQSLYNDAPQKNTEGTYRMQLKQLFNMISEIETADPDHMDTIRLVVDGLYKKIKKRDPEKKVG